MLKTSLICCVALLVITHYCAADVDDARGTSTPPSRSLRRTPVSVKDAEVSSAVELLLHTKDFYRLARLPLKWRRELPLAAQKNLIQTLASRLNKAQELPLIIGKNAYVDSRGIFGKMRVPGVEDNIVLWWEIEQDVFLENGRCAWALELMLDCDLPAFTEQLAKDAISLMRQAQQTEALVRQKVAKLEKEDLETQVRNAVAQLLAADDFNRMYSYPCRWLYTFPAEAQKKIIIELLGKLDSPKPLPLRNCNGMVVPSRIASRKDDSKPGDFIFAEGKPRLTLWQDVFLENGRCAWAIETLLGQPPRKSVLFTEALGKDKNKLAEEVRRFHFHTLALMAMPVKQLAAPLEPAVARAVHELLDADDFYKLCLLPLKWRRDMPIETQKQLILALVERLEQTQELPLTMGKDTLIPSRVEAGKMDVLGPGWEIRQDLFLENGRCAWALEMMLDCELPAFTEAVTENRAKLEQQAREAGGLVGLKSYELGKDTLEGQAQKAVAQLLATEEFSRMNALPTRWRYSFSEEGQKRIIIELLHHLNSPKPLPLRNFEFIVAIDSRVAAKKMVFHQHAYPIYQDILLENGRCAWAIEALLGISAVYENTRVSFTEELAKDKEKLAAQARRFCLFTLAHMAMPAKSPAAKSRPR